MPRRESASVRHGHGAFDKGSTVLKSLLIEKLNEIEDVKERETKLSRKLIVAEEDEDVVSEVLETKTEPPILGYIRTQLQSIIHSPLSTILKGAVILNDQQLHDMIPVAWEMLLQSNYHVTSTAGTPKFRVTRACRRCSLHPKYRGVIHCSCAIHHCFRETAGAYGGDYQTGVERKRCDAPHMRHHPLLCFVAESLPLLAEDGGGRSDGVQSAAAGHRLHAAVATYRTESSECRRSALDAARQDQSGGAVVEGGRRCYRRKRLMQFIRVEE